MINTKQLLTALALIGLLAATACKKVPEEEKPMAALATLLDNNPGQAGETNTNNSGYTYCESFEMGVSTDRTTHVSIGDMNGDGVDDLALTAYPDPRCPGVWIAYMDQYGNITSLKKINDVNSGWNPTIDWHDDFGRTIMNIGDVDGNGVNDLAVSAPMETDHMLEAPSSGSVTMLLLNQDASVKSHHKIGFNGNNSNCYLGRHIEFGRTLSASTGFGTFSISDVNGTNWNINLNNDGSPSYCSTHSGSDTDPRPPFPREPDFEFELRP